MSDKKKLSVIVPCYNEKNTILIIIDKILKSKPINKATRGNLVVFFKEDVSKLEQLLQINLKYWKE